MRLFAVLSCEWAFFLCIKLGTNIDPPYNTGNDFIYKDNFKIDKDVYDEQIGLYDEDENRLFKNTETNGRFHSDWCSMIYPRLKLAHNLLADDGAVFISIDDNEVDNLKKICNEVFGESNFIACIGWHKNYASANDAKNFSNVLDYILVYRKSNLFERNLLPTVIIEHITYNKLKEYYTMDIFTKPNLKGKLEVSAMQAEKHLYDHIIYDSKNERDFASELDKSEEVAVYVKLPSGFYINTPVGKYNPDWAIAFHEDKVKHIYFVAETKGDLSSMQLRKVEELKIHCAREHFSKISSDTVKYEVIDNYGTLLNEVMK